MKNIKLPKKDIKAENYSINKGRNPLSINNPTSDIGEFSEYKQPGVIATPNTMATMTGMTGMMKAKIATEAAYGNPSALRMVSPYPKIGLNPEGTGTHFMTTYDNYAVPLLQDTGKEELEYIENPPASKEDIRFETPEEADYFATHYKDIAPMMRLGFNRQSKKINK